jgi:hypothetical protein
MNNALKKWFLLAVSVLCVAGPLSGCMSRRERAMENLAKMEVVEVDHRGYVRYDGAIVTPGEFAQNIRARKNIVEGKPVFLSVNPEVFDNQPEIVPYIRRVLESVKSGKVYTKIPQEL